MCILTLRGPVPSHVTDKFLLVLCGAGAFLAVLSLLEVYV